VSIGQQPKQLPATPAVPPAADPTTYVIGPADALEITVWKEPTLSGPAIVRPDGKISLALLGDLSAAGSTALGLAARIKDGLQKYIQDPSVYVVVTAVNSQHVFLMGEIQHVGPIPLTAGMTPLQAIATAGGLTPYANSKRIYILRTETSKQVKIPFNYKQALKGTAAQNIPLRSGDTIVVP
jgi:polysaccharide export outer membrane protein